MDSLDALRAACQPLAQRGLVVYLTPEGRRGTSLTHGFHDPQELERLRSRTGSPEPASPVARPAETASPLSARVDQLHADTAELRKLLTDLKQELAETRAQLEAMKAAAGMSAPPA